MRFQDRAAGRTLRIIRAPRRAAMTKTFKYVAIVELTRLSDFLIRERTYATIFFLFAANGIDQTTPARDEEPYSEAQLVRR